MVEVSLVATRTIEAVEHVARVLQEHGVDNAIIGAMALAAHNYLRNTDDVDLATDTDPFTTLRAVAEQLRTDGFDVELVEPDAEDPLGGLLRITRDGIDPIEVVNFMNPRSVRSTMVGREAIEHATRIPDSVLKVVDVPHLIALKLYANGAANRHDIMALLERNPDADIERIREVCKGLHLDRRLEALLADMKRSLE